MNYDDIKFFIFIFVLSLCLLVLHLNPVKSSSKLSVISNDPFRHGSSTKMDNYRGSSS